MVETEKVKVKDKEFTVHELLAIESDDILDTEDKKLRIKKLVLKSANLSEEEYKILTLHERTEIIKAINRLNGWSEDFQKPQELEKTD